MAPNPAHTNGSRPQPPPPVDPAEAEQAIAFVAANYPAIARQLSAINLLLSALPLDQLLDAAHRLGLRGDLILPGQPEGPRVDYRGDIRVIAAAINLRDTAAAVATGR